MLLADSQIRELCQGPSPMISPFSEGVKEVNGVKVISFGISSYGYDFRIGTQFKVFHNLKSNIIDPKNFDHGIFQDTQASSNGDKTGDFIIIPPNSFALGVSIEKFNIPTDILAIGIGKSTLARCGLILNLTPLEAAWKGFLTVEMSNTTPLPMRVYANEGIGQLLFFKGDIPCEINYATKNGKYQNQRNEVTLPKS